MTLSSLLGRSAERFPNHPALFSRRGQVTFAELRASSNLAAQCLRELGAGPGKLVAILGEKELETVTAIWGVLTSGAAYVPLNPRDPPARLRPLAGQCAVVATTKQFLPLARALGAVRILLLDGPAEEGVLSLPERSHAPTAAAEPSADGNAPAYVFPTSGTTGAPKGVVVSHAAALAFVEWAAAHFRFHPGEKLLANAPLYFDLSVLDLFASAAAGAAAWLVPDGYAAFPASLAKLMAHERPTSVYLVPSVLLRLCDLGECVFPSVERVLFAGEALPPKALPRLYRMFPSAEFTNLYGPTETNVCTFFPLDRAETYADGIPIGSPCPYAEISLRDSPEYPGRGELLVAGHSLMRGYLGQAPLTGPYATGDLAMRDEQGRLCFRGRIDLQLKVRGFRVEAEEVEQALGSHPAVAASAVVKDTAGALRAFVQIAQGTSAGEAELIAHCQGRLPYYMVPESIAFIDQWPLGPTGKIDRKELEKSHER